MNKSMYKNYIMLLIGQTISQMGSSMTGFAVVIWAYSNTGQVMASSALAICSMIPYLLLSLLGGAVADNVNKKKIMLICDSIAAASSLLLLLCSHMKLMNIWVLCLINIINGFMNAFQGPASSVAVTLLLNEDSYIKMGGIRSAIGSFVGMINPILASAVLSLGGIKLVLIIDLCTFLFAFVTLLFGVKIPDTIPTEKKVNKKELLLSIREGLSYMQKQKSILFMLIMYSVLDMMGAISFDSMYSPLVLARTGNNEIWVGIISTTMATGCLCASILISFMKQTMSNISFMFIGAFMCLSGIMLFGMSRNLTWWCIVAFCGCFGGPIYSTYQSVILRKYIPVTIQGRVFSIQGMISQSTAPIGYFLGAVLADYVFEPFMQRSGSFQDACAKIVGHGRGAGMGLMFVLAGILGMIICIILMNNKNIKELKKY